MPEFFQIGSPRHLVGVAGAGFSDSVYNYIILKGAFLKLRRTEFKGGALGELGV